MSTHFVKFLLQTTIQSWTELFFQALTILTRSDSDLYSHLSTKNARKFQDARRKLLAPDEHSQIDDECADEGKEISGGHLEDWQPCGRSRTEIDRITSKVFTKITDCLDKYFLQFPAEIAH